MSVERDLKNYFRKKITIVRALGEKWRTLSACDPDSVLTNLRDAESLVRDLESVDTGHAGLLGNKSLKNYMAECPADLREKVRNEYETLRQALLDSANSLLAARARIQDVKTDIGRRLSRVNPRRRAPRHGRVDRKV